MMTPPGRRRDDGKPDPDPSTVRVLLVEDNDDYREWLARIVRRLGFGVETAIDGEHALSILAEATFDLLIADYEMPRVNGLELIRAIRSTAPLSHQYAVMLTSHEDVESKILALTSGYDDFLAKSCSEVEIVAKVEAAKRMLARQQTLSAAVRKWQALAARDDLTGVASRRSFIEAAEEALAHGRTIGLAILDLDDFKPINDTFGHLAGDRILRDVGALFVNRTRSDDFIGRYGGDEFVLLVADQPMEQVIAAAERLVKEVEGLQWTFDKTLLSVRTTTGIAHSSLIPNATLVQLFDAADRDLYAKKWLKKHPGERLELYEYPGRAANESSVVPLPEGQPRRSRRAADEEG